MKLLNVSIIIPTRNRVDSLINTIDSIYKCDYIPTEIIIVDQSTSEVKNKIKDAIKKYKNIEIVYEYQEKPSLTRARNRGLKIAKNDIVIFSDDDICVENDTLLKIFNIFNEEPSVSLIAAIDTLSLKDYSNKLTSLMGYLFFRKYLNVNEGHVTKSIFGRYPNEIKSRIKTEWAMGYFFALRKSIAKEGNIWFDEKLISYAYPEDLDFTYRMNLYSKQIGMYMILDPEIRVEHHVSKEWRETSTQQSLMFIIHREYLSYKLFEKYPVSRLMTRWSNIGEFIRRLLSKDKPIDVLKSQYICDKYRKQLRNNEIPDTIFK